MSEAAFNLYKETKLFHDALFNRLNLIKAEANENRVPIPAHIFVLTGSVLQDLVKYI